MTKSPPIVVPDGVCSPEGRYAGRCPDALRSWFRVENAASPASLADPVDLVIDGPIVDPFMAEFLGIGLSSNQVVDQIMACQGQPLNVWINSDGGLITAGLAIYNQLLMHDAPVTTIVYGFAMSIASVIAMAGGANGLGGGVIMAPSAALFIHEASNELDGTASDHRQMAGILDQLSDQIAGVYARKGDSRVNWRALMQAGSGDAQGTLIPAEEAVKRRLADRIDTKITRQPANLIDLGAYRATARLDMQNADPSIHADGTHQPMTGTHIHSHPAYGAQQGDQMHQHSHTHNGDASHGHHGATGALGLEFYNQGFGVHHTDTTSVAWDDAAQRRNVRTGEPESYYRDIFAWRNPDKPQGEKGSYSFTHHMVAADGTPGAANTTACSTAIGVLNGGRIQQGDSTPWMKDRQAIYDHLAAHLKDANKSDPNYEPPALKNEALLGVSQDAMGGTPNCCIQSDCPNGAAMGDCQNCAPGSDCQCTDCPMMGNAQNSQPTIRAAERALRDAGFSNSRAKAIVAKGWQEADRDDPPSSSGMDEPEPKADAEPVETPSAAAQALIEARQREAYLASMSWASPMTKGCTPC